MFPPPSSPEDGSVLRSRPLLVAFAASASLALVLASSVAVAQSGDSDGDGVPDDLENATQRNVVAVAAGDSFDIQSRLASAPSEDQFEAFYQAGAERKPSRCRHEQELGP